MSYGLTFLLGFGIGFVTGIANAYLGYIRRRRNSYIIKKQKEVDALKLRD